MNLSALGGLDLQGSRTFSHALKALGGSRRQYGPQQAWLCLSGDAVAGPLGSMPLEYDERRLLSLLIEHRGVPLTPETILSRIWGAYYIRDKAKLQGSLAQLRRLLTIIGLPPTCIEEVPGVGYRLLPSIEAEESAPV